MELKCMRTLILTTAVLLTPAAVFAQLDQETVQQPQQQPMQQQQPPSAHPMPQSNHGDNNATPGLTGQQMQDKIFLRKSTESGIAEVNMGKLAEGKGTSEDVKSLGSKMVADRNMLSTEMKPIADSMGIRLPKDMSKADKAEYDRLAALSGDEFDKAFILSMLKAHRDAWRGFHDEMMGTNDPVLKAQLEKEELVIRDHVRLAIKMAKERNILPMRPPAPPPPAQ